MQRVILVTGGTGGLGGAVVRAFLDEGSVVVATYRRRSGFDSLVAQIREDGALTGVSAVDRLHGVEVNLSDRNSVRAAVADSEARFGGIDALVLAAGGFSGGATVEETDDEVLDRMIEMNLRSAFVCVGEAMAALARRRGSIVAVASRSAVEPGAGVGAYAASKAALVALIRSIAAEGITRGVRANAVLPGTIATAANLGGTDASAHPDWVRPVDLAAVIRYLASDDARALNGAAVPV